MWFGKSFVTPLIWIVCVVLSVVIAVFAFAILLLVIAKVWVGIKEVIKK